MNEFRSRAAAMGVAPFRVYLAESLADRYRLSESNRRDLQLWFLLHIAEQAGAGHLCTDLRALTDEMRQWYDDESEPDLPSEVEAELDDILESGFRSGLIGRLEDDDSGADTLPVPRPPLVLTPDRRHLYFLRRRRQEDRFIRALEERASYATSSSLLPATSEAPVSKPSGEPAPGSARALFAMLAAGKRIVLLSGGPGTGKTTTVASLIELISRSRAEAKMSPLHITLAAPTGRAAARLAESVPGATGRTLHGVLGMVPGRAPKHNGGNPIPTDLVVVDESSMVDLPMMNMLLEAVPVGVPIVLAGDPDQLPSVEAGALLGDLLAGARTAGDSHRFGPLHQSVIQLTTVYRSETAVLDVAAAVRMGDADGLTDAFNGVDTVLHSIGRIDEIVGVLAEKYLTAQTAGESFVALTPLRRGPWGVAQLNDRISRIIGGTSSPFPGMPIVMTRNDPSRSLWNGERGRIEEIGGVLRAVFTENEEGPELPLSLLPEWEPGWIQTIHKSQGSEFDAVAVVLPQGANHFLSREILYTAVTRARHRIDLYTDPETIAATLNRRVVRNSRIRRWASGE